MPKISFDDFIAAPPVGSTSRGTALLTQPRRDEIDDAVRRLPPLPALLQQLLGELRNPEADIAKLEEGISSDPGLTTRVLKMANSPFYMRAVEIVDVQRAIMTLGIRTVSNLVLAAGLRKSMSTSGRVPTFARDGIFRHSLASGICCARLGRLAPLLPLRDELFVAGLLHDVGRLVLMSFYCERATEFEGASLHQLSPTTERELLGIDHNEAGGMVQRNWGLPSELIAPITRHHEEAPALSKDEQWPTLAVAAVDEFLNLRGFARTGSSGDDRRLATVAETLGTTAEEIESLLEGFEDEVASIVGAFA